MPPVLVGDAGALRAAARGVDVPQQRGPGDEATGQFAEAQRGVITQCRKRAITAAQYQPIDRGKQRAAPLTLLVPPARLRSAVSGRSMYFCSSLSVLTRSNWKFCSSTRAAGSVSEVKVTVVGSISPATSVKRSCERPVPSCTSRSVRTSA